MLKLKGKIIGILKSVKTEKNREILMCISFKVLRHENIKLLPLFLRDSKKNRSNQKMSNGGYCYSNKKNLRKNRVFNS